MGGLPALGGMALPRATPRHTGALTVTASPAAQEMFIAKAGGQQLKGKNTHGANARFDNLKAQPAWMVCLNPRIFLTFRNCSSPECASYHPVPRPLIEESSPA